MRISAANMLLKMNEPEKAINEFHGLLTQNEADLCDYTRAMAVRKLSEAEVRSAPTPKRSLGVC